MAENINKKRKEDALVLAQLLYDIFKENQSNDKIDSGQNNAQQTQNN